MKYPNQPGYVRNSDTSREAAESMRKAAPSIRERIYTWIEWRGYFGATADEVEAKSGIRNQTITARIRELELSGRLTKTDDKRKTRSGRNARVYVATKWLPDQDGEDQAQGALF